VSAHLIPRDIKFRLDRSTPLDRRHGRVVHEQLPKIGVDAVVLATSAPIRAATE